VGSEDGGDVAIDAGDEEYLAIGFGVRHFEGVRGFDLGAVELLRFDCWLKLGS
jgi:hypothetical protein